LKVENHEKKIELNFTLSSSDQQISAGLRYTDTLTWLMGPNMHAVPACAHTASSYRAVQNGVHDICLLSPPPSRFAGILSSTAAAAATATAEAEAEAAEARVAAAQSAAAQSAAAWSAARAASGRQCGVVWRRECRHRDPTVRRRTDRRPRSLAGLNPPRWELSFAMHSFAGTANKGIVKTLAK
jgi:hypothetical protein